MEHFLFWLIHTLGFWSIAFLLIPLSIFKRLLLFGFIGGFLYTWIVQILAVHVFHIWTFTKDILVLGDIPFFFVLSWTGVTFIFGFLLLRFTKFQYLIVLGFALIAALMNFTAQTHQMIKHDNWSLFQTFMFGVFSHVLMLYLLKLLFKKKEFGAMSYKQDR